MNNTIVYNLVENTIMSMFKEIESLDKYEIVDKCEMTDDELTEVPTDGDQLFIYSYNVQIKNDPDQTSYYLVAIVYPMSVNYMVLSEDLSIKEDYRLEGSELSDSMYM